MGPETGHWGSESCNDPGWLQGCWRAETAHAPRVGTGARAHWGKSHSLVCVCVCVCVCVSGGV